jgi:Na+/H+ antiporter NhaD/arsenite permease-like protein
MFTLAVGVFVASLFLFIFDWVDKTIIALAGAVILVVGGVLNWEEALHAIDFETLVLLIGLMITVAIAQHSGIFSWMNVKIAKISRGNPLAVFLLFSALTFLASTVLNNATVVLLVIPVAIALASGLGMNTKLLVITLAIFSNIGGTLTLIGDPPNTLIGVQVGLSFNDFIINLAAPIFVMTIFILAYLIFFNWKSLKPISRNFSKLFVSNLIIKRITYQFAAKKLDKYMASGIALALLVFKKINFVEITKEIEWDSILFFAGLFVQVGALEKVGFLSMIANFIAGFSGNFVLLLLIIVWGIGLASSIINNIPFVALMIPVIFDLQAKMAGQPHLDLLWWALALGACLGGNGTIIGSSSGILAIDMAKKHGVKISFAEFSKIGMPVTIISLIVSSIYLIVRAYL